MTEVRVWISQCLCPGRHCIMGAAGEADGAAAARDQIETPLREAIAVLLRSRQFNPWCGLCRADAVTWWFETRRTRFATLAQAGPELARLEALNRSTAAMFGDIPRSD